MTTCTNKPIRIVHLFICTDEQMNTATFVVRSPGCTGMHGIPQLPAFVSPASSSRSQLSCGTPKGGGGFRWNKVRAKPGWTKGSSAQIPKNFRERGRKLSYRGIPRHRVTNTVLVLVGAQPWFEPSRMGLSMPLVASRWGWMERRMNECSIVSLNRKIQQRKTKHWEVTTTAARAIPTVSTATDFKSKMFLICTVVVPKSFENAVAIYL